MSDILKIIQDINQIASKAYDGSHDERFTQKKDLVKIGLNREQGDIMRDVRVMDGFSVFFHGPCLCIKYHSECSLKDVHRGGLEEKLEQMIENIASFLRTEYKKITGQSLVLKPMGQEFSPRFEYISKIRSWVTAFKWFRIGNIKEYGDQSSEDKLDSSIKEWMNQ